MHLDFNTWYVRWFFWSARVGDCFLHTRYKRHAEDRFRSRGTTLCQFFRVLLIGAIITTLTIAMYGYLFFVLFVLPFLLFPYTSVGWILLGSLVMLAGLALMIIACLMISRLCLITIKYLHERADLRAAKTQPGFFALFIAYLIAVKHQFCPTIQFDGDDSDA